MMRFLEKYDLEHQKMKCEEGSDEYAAIQPWITDWLKSLHEESSCSYDSAHFHLGPRIASQHYVNIDSLVEA